MFEHNIVSALKPCYFKQMILNNTGMGAHVRSEWQDNVSMAEEGSQIIRVHCEAKTHLWIQSKDYVYYVLMVINVLT